MTSSGQSAVRAMLHSLGIAPVKPTIYLHTLYALLFASPRGSNKQQAASKASCRVTCRKGKVGVVNYGRTDGDQPGTVSLCPPFFPFRFVC